MNAGNKRWNVTTSMVGVKTVTYTKISPKMVNPRDIAGYTEEEEDATDCYKSSTTCLAHHHLPFSLCRPILCFQWRSTPPDLQDPLFPLAVSWNHKVPHHLNASLQTLIGVAFSQNIKTLKARGTDILGVFFSKKVTYWLVCQCLVCKADSCKYIL